MVVTCITSVYGLEVLNRVDNNISNNTPSFYPDYTKELRIGVRAN